MGNFSIQAELDIAAHPEWDERRRHMALQEGKLRDWECHIRDKNVRKIEIKANEYPFVYKGDFTIEFNDNWI